MSTKEIKFVCLLSAILFSVSEVSSQSQTVNFEWREDPTSLPFPIGQRMLKRIYALEVLSNMNMKIDGKIKVTNLETVGSEYATIKLSIQIIKIDSKGQSTVIASSTPSPWEMYKTESYFRDVLVNVETLAKEKIEIWLRYEGGVRIDKAGPPKFEVDKASYLKIN